MTRVKARPRRALECRRGWQYHARKRPRRMRAHFIDVLKRHGQSPCPRASRVPRSRCTTFSSDTVAADNRAHQLQRSLLSPPSVPERPDSRD